MKNVQLFAVKLLFQKIKTTWSVDVDKAPLYQCDIKYFYEVKNIFEF